ncbi:MAG: alpha-amylase [Lachnospiraceae bacterium]|nr:alpha-amylase [Lachnospiraceae bacterium]
MAENTKTGLQNKMIYGVYVRNHTEEGNFKSIISDLDRIKKLGCDYIWFLPIHPIGEKERKGTLGCPYANRDYRGINPEYGTLEDFRYLVEEIHSRGMKCMIDVVYNHTSPDSVLSKEHPEYFYKNAEGNFSNKIGDWSDIIDLDYSNKDLWDYQIESLCMWAEIVDGFRCDVASFIPVEFWKRARKEVEKIKSDFVWLAETVHQSFGCYARRNGIYSALDYEMFEAFDIEYEYDVRETFDRYLKGEITLSHHLDMVNFQEAIYPKNYNKLRFLENHDQPRIASFVSGNVLLNYTAMVYFLKGTVHIYAGQEYANKFTPSLFDKNVIDRNTGVDLSDFMRKMYEIKQKELDAEDYFYSKADDELDIAIMTRENSDSIKIGIFSLKSKSGLVEVDLKDGIYKNLIDDKEIEVINGKVKTEGSPIVISTAK